MPNETHPHCPECGYIDPTEIGQVDGRDCCIACGSYLETPDLDDDPRD